MGSVSSKDPKFIASEILRGLEAFKMLYKAISKYETKVEKDSVKFEVAVNMLHNTENLYIVKFTRILGDPVKYNEICD